MNVTPYSIIGQSDSGWVAVAEYAAAYEAELAAGRLESVGIPARIVRSKDAEDGRT